REERGFAAAGGAHDERAGPARDAAADELVECRDPRRDRSAGRGRLNVLRRDEPREHADPTLGDSVIVVPPAERDATELTDAHAAPLGTVRGGDRLEDDDAVRKALELAIRIGVRVVAREQR